MAFEPVTLSGRHVELVPLSWEHRNAFAEAVRDGELWRLWYTSVPSSEAMEAEIDRRLGLQAAGSMLPFTVLDGPGARPVGMTTYLNIDAAMPRLEVGSTWYAARVQRTLLNTAAKLLLLAHAFDRLVAKFDGVLRHHMRMKDGTIRDTCVYSVTVPEWPTVRSHLAWQLEKSR